MSEGPIQDYAAEIDRLLQEDKQLADSDSLISDLQDMAGDIDALAGTISSALSLRRLMAGAGTAVPALPAVLGELADELESMSGMEPLDRDAVRDRVSRERRVVPRLAENVRKETTDLWDRSVRQVSDALPPPEIRAVIRETDAAVASRISEIENLAREFSNRVPRTVEECGLPRLLVNELQEVVSSAGDLPQDVLDFYAGVTRGIRLSEVTSTVLEWLAERGRLDAYMVYPADDDGSGGRR